MLTQLTTAKSRLAIAAADVAAFQSYTTGGVAAVTINGTNANVGFGTNLPQANLHIFQNAPSANQAQQVIDKAEDAKLDAVEAEAKK